MRRKILGNAVALFIAFVIIISALAAAENAGAQTASPQFLMTWVARGSYAPPQYQGKTLPNQESQIVASLEVIARGAPIAIGGQTIYWYLDDNFLGGGVGAQKITFRPYGEAPTSLTLKVELPNFPGGMLVHEITIPVVTPEAVIDAPYPGGIFSTSPAVVTAAPYFFNASSTSLGISWSVNGQTVADATNPQTLRITVPQNTPQGFPISVTLTVQNSYDSTTATANANLTYQ